MTAPPAELLYLLHGDRAELASACGDLRPADVADALCDLPPAAGAKLFAAIPFDLAVQVFDQALLEQRRPALIHSMATEAIGPLIDAMSGDQQAELFRALPEADRVRLLGVVDVTTRDVLGVIGAVRIVAWQALGWADYTAHYGRVASTVGLALLGVVTFDSLTGSMPPFLLKRLGLDPASASAPFVATLVDVTGIGIYFSVASLMLRGTLL